jgi:hypothetical protein
MHADIEASKSSVVEAREAVASHQSELAELSKTLDNTKVSQLKVSDLG